MAIFMLAHSFWKYNSTPTFNVNSEQAYPQLLLMFLVITFPLKMGYHKNLIVKWSDTALQEVPSANGFIMLKN